MDTAAPCFMEDDLIAPVSARFSLATAYEDLPFSEEAPSGPGTRPFVLRIAGMPAPRRRSVLPKSRYCPERQLAVTDDEWARPIYPMGFERTTVGSKDGQGNPMEDWKPDL